LNAFEPDDSPFRTPVVVVLGALGSGKTTVINRFLATQAGRNWAVVTNESGKATSTARLSAHVEGELVPHAVGCLCCVARSGLVDSLRRLHAARARGPDAAFDGVIVETAGGADPAPVMQTLLNNALVTQYFRLDSVVAVVDVRVAHDDLPDASHDLKQLALADRVLLTHADLVGTSHREYLEARIRRIAGPVPVADGASADFRGAGGGFSGEFSRSGRLDDWLGAAATSSGELERDLHRFRVRIPGATSWDGLHGWLNAGMRMHGEVMYRVRACIAVAGFDRAPVVLQSVQHVMKPPVALAIWGRLERATVLQFVTRELPASVVEESLARDLPMFEQMALEREARQVRTRADPSLPA
jgi:G3E family GTPase